MAPSGIPAALTRSASSAEADGPGASNAHITATGRPRPSSASSAPGPTRHPAAPQRCCSTSPGTRRAWTHPRHRDTGSRCAREPPTAPRPPQGTRAPTWGPPRPTARRPSAMTGPSRPSPGPGRSPVPVAAPCGAACRLRPLPCQATVGRRRGVRSAVLALLRTYPCPASAGITLSLPSPSRNLYCDANSTRHAALTAQRTTGSPSESSTTTGRPSESSTGSPSLPTSGWYSRHSSFSHSATASDTTGIQVASQVSSGPSSSRRWSRASSRVTRLFIVGLLLQVHRLPAVGAVPTVLPVAALARDHLPFVVILANARLALRVIHDSDVGGAVVRQDVAALGHHALGPVAAPQGDRQALGHLARAALDRHRALAVEIHRQFRQVNAVPAVLRLGDLVDSLRKRLIGAALEVENVLGNRGVEEQGYILQRDGLAGVALVAVLAILSGGRRVLSQERIDFQPDKLFDAISGQQLFHHIRHVDFDRWRRVAGVALVALFGLPGLQLLDALDQRRGGFIDDGCHRLSELYGIKH